METNPYEAFPDAEWSLHVRIAEKIQQRPELLVAALQTLDGWLTSGHEAEARLREWRELIIKAQSSAEAMQELVTLLQDRSERGVHLRSFSPFAGILDINERREILFP